MCSIQRFLIELYWWGKFIKSVVFVLNCNLSRSRFRGQQTSIRHGHRSHLSRLATWHLTGGPVGPVSRWAATPKVEVSQTPYPANRGRIGREGRKSSEGQSHKEGRERKQKVEEAKGPKGR